MINGIFPKFIRRKSDLIMRKLLLFAAVGLLMNSCSILNELVAFTNCECGGEEFGELIDIDGEDALKTNMAGFGLIGKSPSK